MCLNPISIPRKVAGRVVDYDIVPCGKCPECVDRKQKDMMQVFLNVAKRSESIVFATFTYDEEHVPFRYSVWDYESGSVVASSFDQSELHCEDDFQDIMKVQSLHRLDWRLWLKNARVKYEREHGGKLPSFTYATIGEYGKLHKRPHYHTLFFNLPLSYCEEICSSWDKGFTYCEQVNLSQSLTSVCRYMAKYLYKGLFESSDVLDQLAERPRVMASKNLIQIDDTFKSWLIGEDLGLSLYTAFVTPDNCERLLARRKLLIDDFNYCLGKHYIDKIFRYYIVDYEGKRKLVPYPLQVALSTFIRVRNKTIFDKEFRQLASVEGEEKAFSMVLDSARHDEISKVGRNESLCQTLQEYYRRSKL